MTKIANYVEYIDISPVMNKNPGVFAGDTQFERIVSMSHEHGDHLELSSIKTSLHNGAHVDASNHYHKDGDGIEKKDLNIYMGECQVIEVKTALNESIKPSDFTDEICTQRVLFKTGSYNYQNEWNENFNSLSGELIDMLASKDVILVGIDTPSIDPSTSKTMDAHKTVYKNNMSILECIDLGEVAPGIYDLNAIPLHIKDADASPVRAILIKRSL